MLHCFSLLVPFPQIAAPHVLIFRLKFYDVALSAFQLILIFEELANSPLFLLVFGKGRVALCFELIQVAILR